MSRLTAVPDSAKLHPGYESVEASAHFFILHAAKIDITKSGKILPRKEEKLKARSRGVGVSVSELIRRTLEADFQQDPVADAKAFFERLKPLESFAATEPESYVRELRSTSRLLQGQSGDA